MSRLIDADALKEHLFVGADYDKAINDGIRKTEEEVFAFKCGWNDALASVMDYAPTVDAVPLEDYKSMEQTVNKLTKAIADAVSVVRCKDCKHYWKNKPSDDVPVCLASPKVDAFCSEGERREDEKND